MTFLLTLPGEPTTRELSGISLFSVIKDFAPITQFFPILALCCNIVVVSGNCFNYTKAGNLNLKLLTPYLLGSIPMSYIGGSLPIEKTIFSGGLV